MDASLLSALIGLPRINKQEGTEMQMLAIDLARQSFHVHGVGADGKVISRRVGRQKLLTLIEDLDPRIIAMEACATAHYWAIPWSRVRPAAPAAKAVLRMAGGGDPAGRSVRANPR
jgi:hypothetical protein